MNDQTTPQIEPRETLATALDQALAEYHPTDAAIAKLAEEYSVLEVSEVDDVEGLELVHAARMDMRSKRVDVDKTRKALKADALKFGAAVDEEAKRITGLLRPIEDRLKGMEDDVADKKSEIKLAGEKAELARIQIRLDGFKALEAEYPEIEIMGWDDETAAEHMALAVARYEHLVAKRKLDAEEQKRQEAEARMEAELLAEEERAKEQERKNFEAEEDAKRTARELAEREQLKAELEAGRKEREELAKERAKLSAELEAEREEGRARAAEAERLKLQAETERLAPQREQILAFADRVHEMIDEAPEVELEVEIIRILGAAAASIRELAE